MADKPRPAEYDLDKKWDRVIDLGLRRIVYGSLAAGITSLILFSETSNCQIHPKPQHAYSQKHFNVNFDGAIGT